MSDHREELVEDVADIIYLVGCNWDREGSAPGSRFADESRDHAAARAVVQTLSGRGFISDRALRVDAMNRMRP